MRHCATQLNLPNLHTVAQRIEHWQSDDAVDVIISRAMSSADDLLRLSEHLGNAHTQWMIMKGREQESLTQPGFRLTDAQEIDVPLLDATRRLLKVVRDD
ncbi:class I SAM-dependent methyltransferase [Suttonella sp. R2A3]|nr:class I SAM-dependent methyltransferase [Suttonella sp. R2A3]